MSKIMGLDSLGQTTDAVVIDLNKDGLKDIYLVNSELPNQLYIQVPRE
jgi:hypothetical protein